MQRTRPKIESVKSNSLPARQEYDERKHGRFAKSPEEFPKKGWKDILVRTGKEVSKDNVNIVAAGIAFYALISIPALFSAFVSVYGLVFDPTEITRQVSSITNLMPKEGRDLLIEQLSKISSQSNNVLTLGAVTSVLVALWSGSKSVGALITALNIAYGEEEKRSFIKLTLLSLTLTLGAIILTIVALGLIAVLPVIIDKFGLPKTAEVLGTVLRWPVLGLSALFGLSIVYRYGACREKPKWRWVSWGAVLAVSFWILGSALFSWYVSSFGKYNETYGSLGAVVITLLWFYLSSYVVMLGAELNAEMEHQTREDSTVGPPAPMGERGATMADTLGRSADGKNR